MNKSKLQIAIFFSLAFKYPLTKSVICAPVVLIEKICREIDKKIFKPTLIAPIGSKVNETKIYSDKIKPLFSAKSQKNQNLKLSQKILKNFIQEKKVDVLNCHWPLAAMPILKKINTPILFTFHEPLNKKNIQTIKKHDSQNYYYNFLSKSHAKNFPIKVSPNKNKKFIINNGLNIQNFKFNPTPKKDLLFSGRLIEKKGVHTAIKVAQETNLPLDVIGGNQNKQYWSKKIEPHLKNNIQYAGMIPFKKIDSFYGSAKILLFPIKWEEAFGLVMIEAMACGTPVIAFNYGSVPEVIKHSITGYIVKNEKEMIKAVKKIYAMPKDEYIKMRRACRKHVEQNFTIEKMVKNYEKVYYKVIKDFRTNYR